MTLRTIFISVETVCIGFVWQGICRGMRYRDGFCENLLEASPMSNTANVSQLQDRSQNHRITE